MSLRLSGGRRLLSPAGVTARPTTARVRQAVMNLLAADLPGSHWLDLCCGSGVMACEALQRGAERVVAIERDRRVAAVARSNLEAVAASLRRPGPAPELRVIQADALRWLARSTAAHRDARSGQSSPRRQVSATAAAAALAASEDDHGLAGDARNPAAGASGGVELDLQASALQAWSGPAAEERPSQLRPAELQSFDLVYVDPPWPAGLHARLSEAVLRGGWIRAGGSLVWECPSDPLPPLPPGWRLREQRRYGGSTVMILQPL